MSNALENNGKEYRWEGYGTDGLRSVSLAKSNSTWSYTIMNGTDGNGAYTFSDSSTGQPFARRGNLYNWTAATLGSGLDLKTDGDEAQDSICPRGWQLPVTIPNMSTSMPATEMTSKSFAKLLKTYGMTKITGTSDVSDANRIKEWPLQYLPTGYYYYSNGYVYDRTTGGHWWSGVAYSATYGYYLNSWSDNIYAQTNYYRGNGFALRCVARNVRFFIFRTFQKPE